MTDKKAITIMGAGDDSGGAIVLRFARKGYIACATRRTEEKRHPWSTKYVPLAGKRMLLPAVCATRTRWLL